MVSNKLIAIIVVVVLAVAGAGGYFLLSDDDDRTSTTGRLLVYGNANGDDLVDQKDIGLIKDSMENWDESEYPFADANKDGKIDNSDVDVVKKIIDRQKVPLHYIDGTGEECTVNFPIVNYGVAGTAVVPMIEALGICDKAVGMTKSSSYDSVLHSEFLALDLPLIGSKAYEIDLEMVSEIDGLQSIITINTDVYDDVEDALKGTQISCIRVNPDHGTESISSFLLLGLLFDGVDKSIKISEFYDRINNELAEKVATISDSDRKTVLTMYSYSICGKDYYTTLNAIAAGGKNLADFSDSSKSIKTDVEWALNAYNPDYIIQTSSYGWEDGVDLNAKFYNYGQYVTLFDCYPENYFCVNKDLPPILRSAFIASVLYPEVFGEDYGEKTLQEYVDEFYGFIEDFDVTEHGCWVITYEDAGPQAA